MTVTHWVGLSLILLLALALRIDDLAAWHQQPSRSFYQEQPLLITFDGYYYLSLAKDLQEGTYTREDPLRGTPDLQKRPWPPPLISMLAVAASWIFSTSLNWAGVILPPILGLTLAIPLYLLSRLYGGRAMALVATCVGLCSNYYVYRSNLGWFDTDCLNVTFALTIAYLFICFGLEQTKRKYYYLMGGMLTYGLFLLWWDQARTVVTLIMGVPLTVVLIFYYRPKRKSPLIALLLFISVSSLFVFWHNSQTFSGLSKQTPSTLEYISKVQTGSFPNTAHSVHEQKKLKWETLVKRTTGSSIILLSGLLGLGWMCFDNKRKSLAMIFLFVLGCLSLIFARRFLIFLNPFIALGLGYLTQQIWNRRQNKASLRYLAPIIAVVFCFFPIKASLAHFYWPKEPPSIIAGFNAVSIRTPKNAVVWAWWDHGYPLRYWGERATINDGGLHSGQRTVCNAIPLASSSQRLSANFIHFYSERGASGIERVFDAVKNPDEAMLWIKKILDAGPQKADPIIAKAGLSPVEKWRHFFFPRHKRELYIFLDSRLTNTAYWWFWYGTWNMKKQEGIRPQFKFLKDLEIKDSKVEGPKLKADLSKGIIIYDNRTYPLSKSFLIDGVNKIQTTYNSKNGLLLALHKESQTGTLMDKTFSESTFSQLYSIAAADTDYFTLVEERYPHYQIWRISPDQ